MCLQMIGNMPPAMIDEIIGISGLASSLWRILLILQRNVNTPYTLPCI